jgi:hypothetical protein
MSIITVTSSVRAIDLPTDGWVPCCGQAPEVFTWPRGMGKGMIGIRCKRDGCINHQGILDYERDAKLRWNRIAVSILDD